MFLIKESGCTLKQYMRTRYGLYVFEQGTSGRLITLVRKRKRVQYGVKLFEAELDGRYFILATKHLNLIYINTTSKSQFVRIIKVLRKRHVT